MPAQVDGQYREVLTLQVLGQPPGLFQTLDRLRKVLQTVACARLMYQEHNRCIFTSPRRVILSRERDAVTPRDLHREVIGPVRQGWRQGDLALGDVQPAPLKQRAQQRVGRHRAHVKPLGRRAAARPQAALGLLSLFFLRSRGLLLRLSATRPRVAPAPATRPSLPAPLAIVIRIVRATVTLLANMRSLPLFRRRREFLGLLPDLVEFVPSTSAMLEPTGSRNKTLSPGSNRPQRSACLVSSQETRCPFLFNLDLAFLNSNQFLKNR